MYLSPRKSRPSYSRIASSASYTSALPDREEQGAYESSLELDETKVAPQSDILDLEALKVLHISDRSLLFVVAYIGHIGLPDIWRSADRLKERAAVLTWG